MKINQKHVKSIVMVFCILFAFYGFANGQTNKADKADKIFAEGRDLIYEDSMDSIKSAISKFEQARELYRELKNPKYEAICLGHLGNLNNRLGHTQKALDLYKQALPLFRAAGDKEGEEGMIYLINIWTAELNKQSETSNKIEFKDSDYKFSIAYPKNWVKSDFAGTRLFVENPELGSLAVKVTYSEKLKDISSTDFANYLNDNPKMLVEYITGKFPGHKLISKEKVKLGNNDAIQIITEKNLKFEGKIIESRMVSFGMLHKGNYYDLIFVCLKEDLEKFLPVIKNIATTFKLN